MTTTSSTARVSTPRPARYGKQLASHFSRKVEARWDSEEGRGAVTFPEELGWGELEMIAGENVLLLQLETSQERLDELEKVVGTHLVRFGARDELTVEWRRQGGSEGTRWRSDNSDV